MTISRPAWVQVDVSALARNTRALVSRLHDSARLMAVVKADGYGHGAVESAKAALSAGASALAVALPEEGAALRQSGISAPILVLGGVLEESASLSVRHDLVQTVFTVSGARRLAALAKDAGKVCPVHLKIDTGMNRIGIQDEQGLRAVLDAVLESPHLRLSGAFTHFADADSDDEAFTSFQYQRFLNLVSPLKKAFPDMGLHACNSAALLKFPQFHLDMVRPGLALYAPPSLAESESLSLESAMSIHCRGVHVKEIAAGDTVGYGRSFTAEKPMRVMTLPIGYADGYHRQVGNQGYVLLHGKKAPVIGRVCMDQCMIDVSDIPQARPGDEAVLLGKQGDEEISLSRLASWCGMIDYEILVSPSPRLPRLYVESPEK